SDTNTSDTPGKGSMAHLRRHKACVWPPPARRICALSVMGDGCKPLSCSDFFRRVAQGQVLPQPARRYFCHDIQPCREGNQHHGLVKTDILERRINIESERVDAKDAQYRTFAQDDFKTVER